MRKRAVDVYLPLPDSTTKENNNMYNDGDLPPGFERNKVEYYGYERRAAETAYNDAYNRGDRTGAERAQSVLGQIREAENSIGRDFDGDGNEIGRSSVPALNIYRRY